jgi:O-acetyl-ADP-ribose deacetylase (regulator of RNase III)
MGTFTEVEGDLFDLGLPAIGHGCNTAGVMGAGIALQFRRRWPEMFKGYKAYCDLGAAVPGSFYSYATDQGMLIYNMFTQGQPGADAKLIHVYAAVQKAMVDCYDHGIMTLGVPRIGAGIGGLKWDDVRDFFAALAMTSPPGFQLVAVSLPKGA